MIQTDYDAVMRCKQALISKIVNCPELIRLIDDAYADEADALIYRNIFPYQRIPSTEETARVYITMKVDIPRIRARNRLIKDMTVTLYVISHQDLMQTDMGGTRIDCMASLLTKLLNGCNDKWLGTLDLVSDTEGSIDLVHRCRTLTFAAVEENLEAAHGI